MSISANYPTVAPSLNLDFANTKALDPRITFSRPTTASYYDANTTALAEQNLFVNSQTLQFFGSVQNLTFVANSTAAPDGTTTATTLNEGTNTGGHTTYQAYSSVAGNNYTISFYVKYISSQYVSLHSNAGANTWVCSIFDVLNGVYVNSTTQGSGWAIVSNSITSVGNSWYRIVTTFTNGSTNSAATAGIQLANSSTLPTNGSYGQLSYTGVSNTLYAWGAQLEQRSSVTAYNATTTTAITNYIPVLQTAPVNQARFDHNPTTRESLGLLIEQQSTNLLTYSSDYTQSNWTKSGTSITPTAVIAPDGTQTAQLFVPTTAAAAHSMFAGTGGTIGVMQTFSIYVKPYGYSTIAIAYSGNGTPVGSALNLATQQIVTATNWPFTVYGTGSPTITAIGNGWYRVTLQGSPGVTGGFNFNLWSIPDGSSFTSAGNGFSGVAVWGAQLEALAFPTSYIPTVASQVTRSADNASMTGTNFSSWYNISQGTLYSEAKCSGLVTAALIGQLFLNVSNYIDFGRYQSSLRSYITSSGTTFATLDTGLAIGSFNKLSVSYINNNFNASGNGGTVQTASSGLVPTGINALNIGSYNGNSYYLNGWIKKMSYYPVAVTSAQLQSLTGS